MSRLPPSPFFILRGHEGKVTALNFNNETDVALDVKPTLLSGSDTGEIFIWNLQTFRPLFKFAYPERKKILFLKYYKSKLFTQDNDGFINSWNYNNNNWTVIGKFESGPSGFCASAFWLSNDAAFITMFDQNRYVLDIYNIDQETKAKELKMNSTKGLCMCLKHIKLGAKQFFLAGFEDGSIELLSGEDGKKMHSITAHVECVTCLDYDSELKMRGISGSADNFLKIWTIGDNLQIENVHELTLTQPGTMDVKIRHDGKIVIAAGWDFRINILSWKTLNLLAVLDFHEETIQCLTCSPYPVDKKNSVFATGSNDKNIALWTIY